MIDFAATANTDRYASSPVSISKDKFAAKDNGLPVGELDAATRQKAEARYFNYYELYAEPDPKATGTADFH